MFGFIFILVFGLFILYYSCAYMGFFPYFELLKNTNNMYFSLVHGVFAKWGLVFGVLLIAFSIFGMKFYRLEDSKFNDMISFVIIFSIIYSIVLIL